MDYQALKKEREENELMLYEGKIPHRVPIKINFSQDVVAGYAGIDIKDASWNPSLVAEKADELCGKIFTDICLLSGKARMPAYYEALGSKNSVMSSGGFMQHPDTVAMYIDEYDEFTKNPVDFIVEKVLPRNYRRLDYTENPASIMFSFLEAEQGRVFDNAAQRKNSAPLVEKYGYYQGAPGSFGAMYATLDLLTDNIRSLKEMAMDVRRVPEKVLAAVDALYPFNYECGIVKNVTPTSMVDYPLHLPPFIGLKQFEKLWWPSWIRQCNDYASMGVHTGAFIEGDWTRYLDYLLDLPTNSRLRIEGGDPALFKQKLGKKHILMGMYPIINVISKSKEENIDEVKRFLDIMAPDGHYQFGFDKTIIMASDLNFDTLAAICDTVRDYGVYENAGQQTGEKMNPKDYTHSKVEKFESKYVMTWDRYKRENPYVPDSARPRVEATAYNTMKQIMNLLR